MYRIGVRRDFVAWHFLTTDDAGPEAERHSHRYRLELTLYGRALDGSGYLEDLDSVRAFVDDAVARYADTTLNGAPEFAGLNPSLENFARILGEWVTRQVDPARVDRVCVTLWEDDDTWASWEGPVARARVVWPGDSSSAGRAGGRDPGAAGASGGGRQPAARVGTPAESGGDA
mgnify:CR=1 FL=1